MHPNPIFGKIGRSQNITFARKRAFGTLAINGEDGPLTAHIPFVLSEDGTRVDLHLMRSNPIARALEHPARAVLTVLGPDSYVSPDWYEIADQVPTWNYIAVRLKGTLHLVDHGQLRDVLDDLSEHMERALLSKTPWTSDKMSDGVMDRMMRSIVPLKLDVSDIDATWKLNQNKPDDVRLRAADQVTAHGMGQDMESLARWMRRTKEIDQ